MNAAILSLLLCCFIVHHCYCMPRKDNDAKIQEKLTSLLRRLTKIYSDEHPLKEDRGTYGHVPILANKRPANVRQGEGDCNPTPDGQQYLGHTSVTVSGKQCQAWASQSPQQHSYNQDYMFPDGSVNDASNYCRNPDDSGGGLWCYTTDPATRWEYCDVPGCGDDCNPSPDGHHYIGHTSVTASGKQCQAWASQSPHQHTYTQDGLYADGSVNDASNYCRNPDTYWDAGPWCYTTDPDTEWDKCNVPRCAVPCSAPHVFKCPKTDGCIRASYVCDGHNACGDWTDEVNCPCSASDRFKCPNSDRCFLPMYVCDGVDDCEDGSDELNCRDCNPTPDGHQYLGHTSVTVSGKQCQAWASQSPHQHSYNQDDMYPDGSVNDASNYCRNPDKNYDGGLWCYTTDPDKRWESCDVPDCDAASRGDCGKPAIEPDVSLTRIVGGDTARAHSWPWQCHIGGCGGSVIDEYHILTAAHCIWPDSVKEDGIHVKCGLHDFRNPSEYITVQMITSFQVTVHEKYDPCCTYDIAIIRLPTRLRFNDYVQPVCLPSSPAEAGTNCIATGWGATKGWANNDVLQQINLPIVSDWCTSEDSVCAGPMVGNKSTCSGDSGGPLVCKQGDRWFQYGISSFVYGCTASAPSGFADVAYFEPWIQQQTGIGPSARTKSERDSKPPIPPPVVKKHPLDKGRSKPAVDPYEVEKELLDLLQRKFADD